MPLGVSFLARRLVALLATVVVVPTLAYATFNALQGGTGQTVFGLAWDYLVQTYWHLDLGWSFVYREPVWNVIASTLPADLAMVLGGAAVGLALGGLGGVLLVRRPRAGTASLVRVLTATVLACPPYFLGFMALILFASGSGVIVQLPFVSGLMDYVPLHTNPLRWLQAMWIPWLAVGLPLAAAVLRMTEASVRDARDEEWVRTARAKGLAESTVVRRHLLPMAVAPVASLTGANMAMVVTNAALMESAFNVPGLLRQVTRLGNGTDYPLVQAMILEGVVLIVGVNTVAELLQRRLDPTVR